MSRFDDLNRALNEEAARQAMGKETLARNLMQMREELLPFVRAGLAVVAEYYDTVLQPRTDLIPVVKQLVAPTDFTSSKPHDRYLINLIHSGKQPYPSVGYIDKYFVPGEIQEHTNQWHPNVALQAEAAIRNHYDFDSKAVTGLRADFSFRVWGSVPRETNAVALPGIHIEGRDMGWGKWGTSFLIEGDKRQPDQTTDRITNVLMMATPLMLKHRDIIQGRK